MKLSTKLLAFILLAIALTAAATLFVQRSVIETESVRLTETTMRALLLEAESVRASISNLNERGAFDRNKLLAELRADGDLRASTLYRTIPVVAAWDAAGEAAREAGYHFRVVRENPRNPANAPNAHEKEILQELGLGADEYFKADRDADEIVYARAVKMTADCLACHGDPSRSRSGDGKDILGFPMEGWKEGETHGAFVLTTNFAGVDRTIQGGMRRSMAWTLPLGLLISGGFLLALRRTVIRPLRSSITGMHRASGETSAAAAQIAKASHALAEGASEQAAAIEETSATLEEIAGMGRRNADSAQAVKTLATETYSAAETGSREVQQMSQAMTAIKGASDNVSVIIKTIDAIAFQTNLLALNAAVEAARAGDAGLGFAVVAEEVRGLAARSAEAARETARLIAEAIARTQHGVELSGKVEQRLAEIVQRSRQLEEQVREIASASAEQRVGVDQVNVAVSQMDQVTQGNAARAEEAASASQELDAQAAALRGLVLELQRLAGEGDGADRRPPKEKTP